MVLACFHGVIVPGLFMSFFQPKENYVDIKMVCCCAGEYGQVTPQY
jgi:hypothetical protein